MTKDTTIAVFILGFSVGVVMFGPLPDKAFQSFVLIGLFGNVRQVWTIYGGGK